MTVTLVETSLLTTRPVMLEGGICLGTRYIKRCEAPAVVVVAGDVAQCEVCGAWTLARNLERALEEARRP